ncbi:PAS domain S-box protein, partial [bacterium]
GEPYDLECRIVRRDGEGRIIRVRLEVEHDKNGRPFRALGTIHDITEHKRALELARASQNRLHGLVENAPLVIWSLDASGKFEFVDGRAMQLMGMKADDYIGRSIFEDPDANPQTLDLARRALNGDEASGIDEKNGFVFEVQYSTLRDDDGKITGAIGVGIDITERRRAEEAARLSQTHLQAVMESAPVVIWATDAEGVFTVSQGRALEVIGLHPGEAIGRSLFEMYGEDSAIAEMARKALQGEESQSTLEVDGHIFDVRYGPTRAEDGSITGVVGVSYDITDRVKAQRERDESEERFARIVTNIPGMVYRFHRSLSGKMSFLHVSEGSRDVYGI